MPRNSRSIVEMVVDLCLSTDSHPELQTSRNTQLAQRRGYMWLSIIRVDNHVQVGMLLNELLAFAVWRFIPIEFGHLAMVVDQHLAQGQVSSWDHIAWRQVEGD